MPATAISNFLHRSARILRGQGTGRPISCELLAIPLSLRAADEEFLAEWTEGRFPLAGHAVPLNGRSPFEISDAPEVWRQSLHGFGWLRHLPLAAGPDAELRVQDLVTAWLESGVSRSKDAMADDVVARRLISWLAHADILLQTPDARVYDGVLNALIADIKTLERRWRSMELAHTRLVALIALIEAGQCLSGCEPMQRSAEAALETELAVQFRTTSSSLWRDPDSVVDLLLDLEPLRLLYGIRQRAVPGFLPHGILHMRTLLSGMLLGDGSAARLGSARRDPDARLSLTAVVRHIGLDSPGSCYAAAAGYARLSHAGTTAIVDVGAPNDCADALGLEISSGSAAMIVHDGLAATPHAAGHCTLLVTVPLGSSLPDARRRSPAPMLDPTHTVISELDNPTASHVDATHAGAARHGFAHRRRLTLDDNGMRLAGIDELRPLACGSGSGSIPFAVRFVLHPSVDVAISSTPGSFDLSLTNGHRWHFSALGCTTSVEVAVYRDGLHTIPTLQILVLADAAHSGSMAWQFTRVMDQPSKPPAKLERPRRSLTEALAAVDVSVPIAKFAGDT